MFEGQPKGLFALALANTGERFGYYTMIAVFALFLRENFGLDPGTAGAIPRISIFLAIRRRYFSRQVRIRQNGNDRYPDHVLGIFIPLDSVGR